MNISFVRVRFWCCPAVLQWAVSGRMLPGRRCLGPGKLGLGWCSSGAGCCFGRGRAVGGCRSARVSFGFFVFLFLGLTL